MQQIIYFILKNSYKLLFLLLLGMGLALTIKSHSYHRSTYINSANEVSGLFYQKLSDINEYLSLKERNEALSAENARLKQILFNKPDTLLAQRNFLFSSGDFVIRKAKIIRNSFNVRENYLTLNKGKRHHIKTDMGVVNDKGIVGIVEKTSHHFATILSVLNTKSRINAKIKHSEHFGSLIWDGKNAGYVQLIDVPRLATLKKGDSIVTGSESEIFPENIPIGKIDKVFIDPKTNYYTINVRLFNDMTALGYVYVIENKKNKEKRALENENTTK